MAFLASGLVAWYAHFQGKDISVIAFVLTYIFVVAFVPLVVIRLPVFNKYYVKGYDSFNKTHHNFANYRAAPIMVGLVSGVTVGLILGMLKVKNPEMHAFCGAVAAIVNSYYFEPKF